KRDGAKRPIVGRLLAEEEAKLAALTETVATEGWEQLLDMVARHAAELLGAEDPGMNPPRERGAARFAPRSNAVWIRPDGPHGRLDIGECSDAALRTRENSLA
ncbi:MAG: hypothetical protein KGI48_12775, partial [Hyphomicrobiales bacterium]|nr:hypothetical protein [Hyphomicrobiales bacterium]